MSQSAAQELASLIKKLQDQRQQHLDAIANIDATFEQFGISVVPAKRLGRPRKAAKPGRSPKSAAEPAKKSKRKARRHFPVSGLDSVLAIGADVNE